MKGRRDSSLKTQKWGETESSLLTSKPAASHRLAPERR